MDSRWEAGDDTHQSRYSGWWKGSGVVGLMVMMEVGVVSFSEAMYCRWRRWSV